jgi:phosphomannomutase/phosphoglucomutase
VEVARFDGARLSTIDGLRADWDDGWGLLRASNTTPVLVLRFEADDQAALDRVRDTFRTQLQVVAPELKITF